MKVFLLGSSGLVGSSVYSHLARQEQSYEVIAFNRRRLNLPKALEKVSDLSDFKQEMEGLSANIAVCALGTTIAKAKSKQAFEEIDMNLPLRFAVAAHAAGVQSFHIVTALGADVGSKNFYLRTKGLLERELNLIGFEALHIYRPSLLIGERQEFRLGEAAAVGLYKAFKAFYPESLDRYRPIEVEQLSRFIVAKLQDKTPGLHVWENRAMLRA